MGRTRHRYEIGEEVWAVERPNQVTNGKDMCPVCGQQAVFSEWATWRISGPHTVRKIEIDDTGLRYMLDNGYVGVRMYSGFEEKDLFDELVKAEDACNERNQYV